MIEKCRDCNSSYFQSEKQNNASKKNVLLKGQGQLMLAVMFVGGFISLIVVYLFFHAFILCILWLCITQSCLITNKHCNLSVIIP